MKTDILLKIVIVILPIYLYVHKPTEAVEEDVLDKGQQTTRTQALDNQKTQKVHSTQEGSKDALSKRETEDDVNIGSDFNVQGPNVPMIATVGEDIILQCQVTPAIHSYAVEVFWHRLDPEKSIVIQKYKNEHNIEERHELYVDRIEMFSEEIVNGNISLKMKNAQPSDMGDYVCSVVSGDEQRNVSLHLEVAALGSKPLISFEKDQTSELSVTCTSEGWFPKPEVLWTDWNGDVLPEKPETELELNDKGLYSVKSSIHTDTEALNGLSCIIKNNLLKKEQRSAPPKLESFIGLKLVKSITGVFGKEVLLPCFFTLKTYPQNLEVSWVKTNFKEEIPVHSFSDGRITSETQGESYSSRTKLYKELHRGNFSLTLLNVVLSDQGKYVCSVKTDKGIKRALIQLYVTSVGSNPFLTILCYEEKYVTFICKSQKWFPQPEVSWTGEDVQRFLNNIETKFEEDNEGLYQIQSVIHLQKDSITGLSCSIKNVLLQEEKQTVTPHTGSFDVVGPSEPVFALIGEDVLLPCLCTVPYFSAQTFDVKWIKTEVQSTEEVYTFISRESHNHEGQNYKSRVTLYIDEFEYGNVSLKLSSFQVADSGNYICSVRSEHGVKDAVIQLIIAGIGPKPFVSIVEFQDEEIKLVCKSSDWDLRPEVLWMDEKGQDMNALSETFINENEKHRFDVHSYLTMRSNSAKQVYCKVRNNMGKEHSIPEKGDFAVLGPKNTIFGILGEDVLLPCMLMARKSPIHLEIRWIKTKFPSQSSVTVYSFSSGMNIVEQVDKNYKNQVELHIDFFSTGNISMKLSKVQLSDSGNYTCIVQTEKGRKAAIIELKVAGLGEEPFLDIANYMGNTVTVNCNSKDWFPEPEILWITEKGENLTGNSATNGEFDENGLFAVQSSITVKKNSIKHLTCIVKNTWVSHQESNSIPIPDNFLIIRPRGPVTAVTGGNITLPCQLQPKVCPSDMILEWVKAESDNQVTVLNYKKGPTHSLSYTEDYTTKAFVVEEEFCSGSLSLQLQNVQLSDMGTYVCSVKSGKIRGSAKVDVYITDEPPEDIAKPPSEVKEKDDASKKDKKKKKEKVHPLTPAQDIDDTRKKVIYSDCLFILYKISIVIIPVIIAILIFACIICRCCQKGEEKMLKEDAKETDKKDMEEEMKVLREQKDVAETAKKDMETELKILREEKAAAERAMEHMKADMKTLHEEKDAALREKKAVELEMKKLQEQKDAAEIRKKHMETEIKRLSDQKDAAERDAAERERITEELDAAEREKERMEADVAEREKKHVEEELERLHAQKDVAEREKKHMEEELERLHAQKDATEKSKKHMEKEAAEKEKSQMDLANAEREKRHMETELERLHAQKDAAEKSKKHMEKEMKALREQKEAAEKEKSQMDLEMKILQEAKDNAEREKRHMETELERLHAQKEMKALREQKEAAEKEEMQMDLEMKILQEAKDNAEREKRRMETDMEILRNQKDDAERDEIRKKAEIIQKTLCLETVQLDPETAHPKLLLKDNTVKHVDQWKDVSDNPHRFDSHFYVLGSKIFQPENHYWIVEVGDKTEWDLGIASDSVNRKGSITLSPANGFWVIGLCNETDYWARASSVKKLKITDKPRMIGIFLQYDQKQVSFYNAESLSHLYSFSNCEFGQDLKPFFSPGTSSNGMNSMALKVLQKYFH